MSKQLKLAVMYFAEIYQGAVVGSTLEESYSAAEQVAHEFKHRYANTHGLYPDWCVADYVRNEAHRYSDM